MKNLLAWIVIIFAGLALTSAPFAADKDDKPKPKKKTERKY
jgi:hypothetical protein